MNTEIADISHVNNSKYFGYIYDYIINIVIYLNILENNNYCKPLVANCCCCSPPRNCIFYYFIFVLFQLPAPPQINRFY